MPDAKQFEDMAAEVAKAEIARSERPGMALYMDEEAVRKSPHTIVKTFHAARRRRARDEEDRDVQRYGDLVVTAAQAYMVSDDVLYHRARPTMQDAIQWAMNHPDFGVPYRRAAKSWLAKAGVKDDRFAKALDTQETGHGAEFVPTGYSSEFDRDYRLKTFVFDVGFKDWGMKSITDTIPRTGSRVAARLLSEQTGDNTHTESNFYTAIDHNTGNRQATAKKLGFREVMSDELVWSAEDMGIDLISELQFEAQESQAMAAELACISGDTTATHQDYDVHSATGNATDARRSWIGWRKAALALNEAVVNAANGRPTYQNFISLKGLMGKYGAIPSDVVYVTGPLGHAYLLGLPEKQFVPAEDEAVYGLVGKLLGSRVFVSEHFPENLHDTGVNTNGGDNDTTSVLAVNTKSWIWGRYKPFRMEIVLNRVSGQRIMVVDEMMIHTYGPLYSTSGNRIVGNIYNIK